MIPAREEALFTSALEIPDRLMADSHDKRQNCKRRLTVRTRFATRSNRFGLPGHEPHIDDVLSSGNSVHRDLGQQ